MEVKKAIARLALLLLGMVVCGIPVFAQADQTLSLRLSRDFGYSSGTGKVQGTFSIIASGPPTLERVVFMIDIRRKSRPRIDASIRGDSGAKKMKITFAGGDHWRLMWKRFQFSRQL